MSLAQRTNQRRENQNPSPTQRRRRRPRETTKTTMRRRMMQRMRRRKRRNLDHQLEPRLVPRKMTINPNPLRPPRRLKISQSLPRRTINPLRRKQTINPNLPRKMRRNQSQPARPRPMINLNLLGNQSLPPRRMRINQSLLERRILLVRSPSLLERERRMIRPRGIRRRLRLRWMCRFEMDRQKERNELKEATKYRIEQYVKKSISTHMAVRPSLRKASFLSPHPSSQRTAKPDVGTNPFIDHCAQYRPCLGFHFTHSTPHSIPLHHQTQQSTHSPPHHLTPPHLACHNFLIHLLTTTFMTPQSR